MFPQKEWVGFLTNFATSMNSSVQKQSRSSLRFNGFLLTPKQAEECAHELEECDRLCQNVASNVART